MKKILLSVLALLLALQLSGCSFVIVSVPIPHPKPEPQTTPVTTPDPEVTQPPASDPDAEPLHLPPEPDGVITQKYPDPQTAYAGPLTEEQKYAYNVYAQLIEQILETGGKEDITLPLDHPMHSQDTFRARAVYHAAFGIFDSFMSFIDERIDPETRMVVGFSFHRRNYLIDFDSVFDRYVETLEAADAVLYSIVHDGTELEIAEALYRWVIDNTEYAYDYQQRHADNWLWDASGPLLESESVCSGYAQAFDLLCKRAGLTTICVVSETHEWNMLCLNGTWYYLDATWADGVKDYYGFFLMSEEICTALGHDPARYLKEATDPDNAALPPAEDGSLYRGFGWTDRAS